jgi:hypothetical protein
MRTARARAGDMLACGADAKSAEASAKRTVQQGMIPECRRAVAAAAEASAAD